MPARQSLVLVANRESGHKKTWLDRSLRAIADAELRIVETLSMSDLERLRYWVSLPHDQQPIIVAAGGDGTIGGVVEYVAGTDAVLGILPLGTSNDIARSLNIPVDADAAVGVLAEGHIGAVDVGELIENDGHSRYFVHAAAMGLNVAFAKRATQTVLRKRLGRLTYVAAALMAMKDRQPFTCRLEVEGEVRPYSLLHLSVVNAPVFGGFLGLKIPGSSVDDGRLDVLTVTNMPLARLLWTLLATIVWGHADGRHMNLHHVSQLSVLTEKSLDVSLDGEVCGKVPGEYVVRPGALRILASTKPGNRG